MATLRLTDKQFLNEHKRLRDRIRKEELFIPVGPPTSVPRRGVWVSQDESAPSSIAGLGPYTIPLQERIYHAGVSDPSSGTKYGAMTPDVAIVDKTKLTFLTPGFWRGDLLGLFGMKFGSNINPNLPFARIGFKVLKNGTDEVAGVIGVPTPDAAFGTGSEWTSGWTECSMLPEQMNYGDYIEVQACPGWWETSPSSPSIASINLNFNVYLVSEFS